ncbi:MAG: DUF2892 domain-containing protein [Candidatus Krumholzibacteria bacterium]|nr:DUF2892 domain-containing protein [Candidatus Krumholzibacteria bacterium]
MEARPSSNAAPCATISWSERMVRRLAGVFIIASLLLAWKVSPWWLALNAFVGVNLFQSSFTGFCPPEILFRRMEARRNAKTAATAN